MKFNAKKAEYDYITDNSISYRRLAEKYEVSFHTVQSYAKKHGWVEKRKNYQSKLAQKAIVKSLENQSEKLSKLSTATDKAIEYINKSFAAYENQEDGSISITVLKDIATTLKTLTGVQRDLNGILTVQETNALALAKEKLEIEREKVGVNDTDDNETGVVFMPALVSEETEHVVKEGEHIG